MYRPICLLNASKGRCCQLAKTNKQPSPIIAERFFKTARIHVTLIIILELTLNDRTTLSTQLLWTANQKDFEFFCCFIGRWIWQWNISTFLVKCSLYFLPPPTFALATPRTFFCLFFLSLRCFLPIFLISNKPCYKKQASDIQNKNLQHLISFTEQNTHITEINMYCTQRCL